MWFHLELAGHGHLSARAGVAVARTPVGPFTFTGSFRPNAGVWPDNVSPADRKALSPEEEALLRNGSFPAGRPPTRFARGT